MESVFCWSEYPVGESPKSLRDRCERRDAENDHGGCPRTSRLVTRREYPGRNSKWKKSDPIDSREEQFPIAWAGDAQHIFTQELNATSATIYKVDLGTGRSELWQTIKPKDQVGLRQMNNAVAITPDGRWMAYQYGTQIGQLYVSDTLK